MTRAVDEGCFNHHLLWTNVIIEQCLDEREISRGKNEGLDIRRTYTKEDVTAQFAARGTSSAQSVSIGVVLVVGHRSGGRRGPGESVVRLRCADRRLSTEDLLQENIARSPVQLTGFSPTSTGGGQFECGGREVRRSWTFSSLGRIVEGTRGLKGLGWTGGFRRQQLSKTEGTS